MKGYVEQDKSNCNAFACKNLQTFSGFDQASSIKGKDETAHSFSKQQNLFPIFFQNLRVEHQSNRWWRHQCNDLFHNIVQLSIQQKGYMNFLLWTTEKFIGSIFLICFLWRTLVQPMLLRYLQSGEGNHNSRPVSIHSKCFLVTESEWRTQLLCYSYF